MRFDILTLFPDMFAGPLTESILAKAREKELINIHLTNIRDYATDKHHITDDTPYGGGGGMVMKVDPVVHAVEDVVGQGAEVPVLLMSPQGRVFNQRIAQELAQHERLVLVCGRYEGVDERVRELVITDEISIGDYVITGGELAAMVIVDAVSRLVPGVLGARWGAEDDSHATGLLEYPHYTRPAEFRGLGIPEVLISGHHANVEKWRRQESLRRTLKRRPDLLETAELSDEDRAFLDSLRNESG
ncbi:MAG: tRNA (guanosine(37)-N1)-methyltransferase TrmD [Chloroflexi bacterium]|nr:tRNA (guanosine(37)-N1)-methyltransferase TrmD [Chloroflexota bacterium]